MDKDTIQEVWPYVFNAPTMDRSQGSHMANPDRLPWLCGIDGRHRGGLSSYLGHNLYGGSPVRKTVIKCTITSYTDLAGDSVTFDEWGASSPVVLTAGSEWTAGSSNALTAASLKSAIDTAVTTTAFPELLYVSTSIDTATVTLTVYHLSTNAGDLAISNATGWSWTPVSGLSSDTPIGDRLLNNASGAGVFPFAVDVDYAKYVEIRKTSNTIQRGFLARDSATGWLVFFYNEAFNASAWTGAYLVDTTGDFLGLRMSSTYLGRVLYIVGSNGTTSRKKVVYWDEDTSAHTTEEMGPVPPIDTGANLTDGYMFYMDTSAKHISRANLGGDNIEFLRSDSGLDSNATLGYDATNDKVVYVTRDGTNFYLRRMDVDGSNHETIWSAAHGGGAIRDLYVDNTNGYIFLLRSNNSNQLKRFDLDGTNETNIVSFTSGSYRTTLIRMTMDEANEHIYFTDTNDKDIQKLDISGGSFPITTDTSLQQVTSFYATEPQDIAYDATNDRLYAIDATASPDELEYIDNISTYTEGAPASSADAIIDTDATGFKRITIDNFRAQLYVNKPGNITRMELDGTREIALIQGNITTGLTLGGIAVQEGNSKSATRPTPVGLFEVFDPNTSRADARLSPGAYDFRVRYYDQRRRRFSPLSNLRTLMAPSITDAEIASGAYLRFIHANDEYFDPIARDYDQIQWFSSTSAGLDANDAPLRPSGTLYLRGTYDIPTDDFWYFVFGKGDAEASLTDLGGQSGNYPDAEDSLTDLALAQQGFYNPLADYVTSTVPDLEQIHYYGGSNFGLAIQDGFLDIRWTPLDRIEPENWQELNFKRTQIPALGVASFIEAGDFLWVLGDNESYRIQKVGTSMSIHKKLVGYKFVGPHCACAVGSNIIAVTTSGVLNINANSGDYVQISSLDRIILKRWANNLETTGQDQPIQVEYDSRLGAIYIWNRRLGECAILWTTTNRVTFLTDCWFQHLTSGFLPNSRSDGRRVFWITETQATNTTESFDPGGGFFLNPVVSDSTTPNMLGLDVSSTIGEITFLVGQGFGSGPASEDADGNTYLQMEVGSSSGAIEPGRLCGGVLYVLTGDAAGNKYKIVASTREGDPSGNRFKIHLDQEVSGLTNDDIVSICPVPVGVVGWPLGSRMFSQDMLSRRVVDAANTILGSAAGTTSVVDYSHFQYGLLRYEDVNDDEVLDAVSDPTGEAASGFPWTNTWEADTAENYTIDTSSPADNNDTAGLYAPLEGDGGLIFPTFQCVLAGLRFSLLAMYLQGEIHPNDGVQTT